MITEFWKKHPNSDQNLPIAKFSLRERCMNAIFNIKSLGVVSIVFLPDTKS